MSQGDVELGLFAALRGGVWRRGKDRRQLALTQAVVQD